MISSSLTLLKYFLILKNLRLSNLKRNQRFILSLVLLAGALSLALFIRADQIQKRHLVFLKKTSPYYMFFNNIFKDSVLITAWEKDLTADGKSEFIFSHRQANCANCQILFSIFQGEKEVFKTSVNKPDVIFKDKGFMLNNGKDRYFQWTGNEFKDSLND